MKKLIDNLYKTNNIQKQELLDIVKNINEKDKEYLTKKAHDTSVNVYSNKVFLRGLIEFTNYCKKSCVYCGINASNKNAIRYRLDDEQILECARYGNKMGYKTFVLQGGEDPYFDDEKMLEIIYKIKNEFPDSALTLSIGERSFESYKKMYDAGANRYLLRHETSNKKLYEKLHPNQSFENRINCLYNLKDIGYQVGAGFMVGIPTQTDEDLVDDLMFLKKLNPHMCGIGPFVPHKDTIFKNEKSGCVDKTTMMLSLTRLLLKDVLLPATTALSTIDEYGREKGLKSGANVVMPNLSPDNVRNKYSLYDGKKCVNDEDAKCMYEIEKSIKNANFVLDYSRGDNINWTKNENML